MKIVYHLGAHYTDEGLILNSLLKNAQILEQNGILVPRPQRYRSILRDKLQELRGKPATDEVQDVMLDRILGEAVCDRVIFSFDSFISRASHVFHDGKYYGKMGMKAQRLRNLFPDFEVEFCIGLRDPATHIPTFFQNQSKVLDFSAWCTQIDMQALSWKRTIEELRNAVPDAHLTVWCNEDTPLIWPEVLQGICNHSQELTLKGNDALLASIMSQEGLHRMRSYLSANPPKSVHRRRQVVTVFLDKFGLEDAMEEEVDLPGWTHQIMDGLSDRYDSDIDAIAQLPHTHVILP